MYINSKDLHYNILKPNNTKCLFMLELLCIPMTKMETSIDKEKFIFVNASSIRNELNGT